VGLRNGLDVCKKSRPPTGTFFVTFISQNSLQKFFFLPCLPYILYIASQGTIPTLPVNPWEHILIVSSSVRTSLRSFAGERKKTLLVRGFKSRGLLL
jgi:hypothetical protein